MEVSWLWSCSHIEYSRNMLHMNGKVPWALCNKAKIWAVLIGLTVWLDAVPLLRLMYNTAVVLSINERCLDLCLEIVWVPSHKESGSHPLKSSIEMYALISCANSLDEICFSNVIILLHWFWTLRSLYMVAKYSVGIHYKAQNSVTWVGCIIDCLWFAQFKILWTVHVHLQPL